MTDEDPFPRPGPNGRCQFGRETFAAVRGNGRDAPFPDLPSLTPEGEVRPLPDHLATSTFLFLVSHGSLQPRPRRCFSALASSCSLILGRKCVPQGLKPTTATAGQPAPADATAPTAEQPAPNATPRAVIPYYPSSPTTAAMRVDPHLIVAFARAAANRELPSNSIVMGAYGICGSSRRGKIDRLGNERGGAVFAGEPAKTS